MMSDLVGHDKQLIALRKALQQEKLHHALLLAGPRGIGKASFAKAAAAEIVDPNSQHRSLCAKGNHPDIITIRRPPKEEPKEGEAIAADAELKRSIAVDQIRALQNQLTRRPSMSQRRVIIIDAADDMERNASNALLKSLEEPPAGSHFMLVSHSASRLLPTIRSRCQKMQFAPLAAPDLDLVLRRLLPDIAEQELSVLSRISEGSPGLALEFAGLELFELEQSMQAIIAGGDPDNSERVKLATQLSSKSAQLRYEAFLRRVPSLIAAFARQRDIGENTSAIAAWKEASELSARAIGLSLDKTAIVLQMGGLLASLANKARHAA